MTGKIASKEEERQALKKIRKIIDDLGQNSYVGTAFDGCFEIAEDNIGNDFAYSPREMLERAEKKSAKQEEKIARLEKEVAEKDIQVEKLKKKLEKEEEWIPYKHESHMTDEDYNALKNTAGSTFLTETEAKKMISKEFGFSMERIRVVPYIQEYECNRHHALRPKRRITRLPLYFSTDWNYIRFSCANMYYEMCNGQLCISEE